MSRGLLLVLLLTLGFRVVDDPALSFSAPDPGEAAADSLVVLALRSSPELAARTARADAARQGAPAAGALPDPMLGFSVSGEDYPGSGIGTDPMAMASLEVSQMVPWPGKRARREAAAVAGIAVAEAELEVVRRRTAATVRVQYADLAALAGEAAGLREVLALLEILVPQTLARYETGRVDQADLLRLTIERAGLEAELDRVEADRIGVAAGLNAGLDRAPSADLPPAVLPADPGSSATTAETFAEVRTGAARTEAARRSAAAAESEGTPDLVLGAEYGWRDAFGPMVTARVGIVLPLWHGRKQDAAARAASSLAAGAAAEQRRALAEARAEVAALQARLEAARRRVARLRDEIIPQVELAVAAARTSYETGQGEIEPLMDGLQLLAGTRAGLTRSKADVYAAWATLRALAGDDPALAEPKE